MSDPFILSIWERLLQPDVGPLPPEVARYALRLELAPDDQARMGELGQKAQCGTLTADERAELDAYSHAAAFLSILQSKARVALRAATPVSGNGTPAA